jgi:small subunit ribosomal protein S18
VDINDPEFLRRYVTEQGKILPIRITGLNAKQQRKLKQGVRRARNMGLLM